MVRFSSRKTSPRPRLKLPSPVPNQAFFRAFLPGDAVLKQPFSCGTSGAQKPSDMNLVQEPETALPVETTQTPEGIRVKLTLLGFERITDYILLSNPEEAPFYWLQVQGDPGLAFVVVEPFFVDPHYQPDINPRDTAGLDIHQPEEAILLNIVNVQGQKQPTVNLKGPIVINRRTMIGKQVIPDNAARYSIKVLLPVQ